MPTHEEMTKVVDRYVEAFAKGDPELVVALFADDATVEDPVGTDIVRGHDEIRTFYTNSMQTGAKLRLDGPVRTGGGYAAFPFSVLLNFDGGEKVIEVIDTFRFNEAGKVVEMRAYWGPENMR